jgi:hypothetical protein
MRRAALTCLLSLGRMTMALPHIACVVAPWEQVASVQAQSTALVLLPAAAEAPLS